ncbi:hypothetical protein [Clostridium sp.]|uniref:hypothetical protein n=1 Tax=Clostridium sp. TaxID=1506 RepID=UPI0026176658|nr:hypothetical protein [Clostridium sp.]
MSIRVSLEINIESINTLLNAVEDSLVKATEAIKEDIMTSQVVPKLTGALEDSCEIDTSDIKDRKTSITFSAPYVNRVYFHPELNFRTDKNANAQGMWMQSYIDGDKKNFALENFSQNLKESSKGVIK